MREMIIKERLLKRLITQLWYNDAGLDDVEELSREIIDEYPRYFVDVHDDGKYIGTMPWWLENEKYINHIEARKEDKADEESNN